MSDEQEKPRLPVPQGSERPSLGGGLSLGGPSTNADEKSVVSFFRSVPLFNSLDADQVMEIMRVSSIETYSAGEVLFEEDEAGDAMVIIERGEVAITKRSLGGEEVTVAFLGDGSVVGEMALIVSSPRTASVKAVSETRIYRLNGRDFDGLRRQRSLTAYKILFKLLEALGDRRQRVVDRIDDIFARPADHVEQFERQVRELGEKMAKVLERGDETTKA
jgi:CRP-like cAMP-binding protein